MAKGEKTKGHLGTGKKKEPEATGALPRKGKESSQITSPLGVKRDLSSRTDGGRPDLHKTHRSRPKKGETNLLEWNRSPKHSLRVRHRRGGEWVFSKRKVFVRSCVFGSRVRGLKKVNTRRMRLPGRSKRNFFCVQTGQEKGRPHSHAGGGKGEC